jgi:hypothetical protein
MFRNWGFLVALGAFAFSTPLIAALAGVMIVALALVSPLLLNHIRDWA